MEEYEMINGSSLEYCYGEEREDGKDDYVVVGSVDVAWSEEDIDGFVGKISIEAEKNCR